MNTTHASWILALCIALPACDTAAGNRELEADELQDREGVVHSGEELFLGIFFGQGEVALQLPGIWGDCGQSARAEAIAQLPVEVLLAEVDRLEADPRYATLLPLLERTRQTLLTEGVVAQDPDAPALIVELVRARDPDYFDALAQAVYSGEREAIREAIVVGQGYLHDILWIEQEPIGPDEDGLLVVYDTVVFVDTIHMATQITFQLTAPVVSGALDSAPSLLFEEMMIDEIAARFAGA